MRYPYHVEVLVDESKVYPVDKFIPFFHDLVPIDPPSGDQYFNFRVIRTQWDWSVSSTDADLNSHTTEYDFLNISKSLVKPTTLRSRILNGADIPEEAHKSLMKMILDVAKNMVSVTHKDQQILCICVEVHIDAFYSVDDEISDYGYDGDYDEAEVEEDGPSGCTVV